MSENRIEKIINEQADIYFHGTGPANGNVRQAIRSAIREAVRPLWEGWGEYAAESCSQRPEVRGNYGNRWAEFASLFEPKPEEPKRTNPSCEKSEWSCGCWQIRLGGMDGIFGECGKPTCARRKP